jgi:hypothetical protein
MAMLEIHARAHRQSALAAAGKDEAARLERLVEEYDGAIRRLSMGERCALDCKGEPLVKESKA